MDQSIQFKFLKEPTLIQQVLSSNIEFENHTVYLSLLLNCYSFQYTTGNYIFDMYVSFLKLHPNISTGNWYFTNGYAYPNSEANVLLGKNLTSDITITKCYRVTASLNTPPNAKDYPFDKISLKISIDFAIRIITNVTNHL